MAATLIAMIGPEPERGRESHREVLDHGAVDVGPAVDLARREDAGQRARGRHRVRHPRVEQAGQAPHHLHAGVEIGCVDEEAALEIAEGDVADEARDQRLERLAAVEGRRQQPPERHVHAGHLEHVAPPDLERPRLHLRGVAPGRPGGADQRPDARPHHQARHQPALLERAEHADVGEPFEAAAAENQGEGSVRVHSLAPVEVTCVTFARTNVQESCAVRREVERARVCALPTRQGNPRHGTTMPPGVLRERLRRDRFFQLGLVLVALVVAAAACSRPGWLRSTPSRATCEMPTS